MFDGYCKAEPTFAAYADSLVSSLFSVLSERSLPYEQMRQILAVLKSRIKANMLQKLHAFVDCKSAILPQFPAKAIRNAVNVIFSFRVFYVLFRPNWLLHFQAR